MKDGELQEQLDAQVAENAFLQQQAAAAQEVAAKLMEATRQEVQQLQAEVHRLEQEKLARLKARATPQLTTALRTAAGAVHSPQLSHSAGSDMGGWLYAWHRAAGGGICCC